MFETPSQSPTIVPELIDMISWRQRVGSGRNDIGNRRNYNARRSTGSSTNSIKRFICRSEAPPEGMSRSVCISTSLYSRLRVRASALAAAEEEREQEKDERTFQPTPRRVVASRNNTMLLMLRLQFRHNFLSRPRWVGGRGRGWLSGYPGLF